MYLIALILLVALITVSYKYYQCQKVSREHQNHLKNTLAEEERHYYALTENSPDLIVRYDRNGRRLYVNQTYQRVTGIPVESLIGKTIIETSVVKENAANVLMNNISLVFETGTETSYEVHFNVQGRDYYYDYHCIPETDAYNQVQSVLAVGRDITEYKNLEIQLQNLARTDVLTGIANRRSFMDRMSIELASVKRYHVPACLLMIDIDHFKQINDRYGHAGGDTALIFFSELVQKNLRNTDVLGRIGGEKFAIISHLTPYDAVLELSERLRTLVAASVLSFKEQVIKFTISIGVTNLGFEDADVSVVFQRADKALYEAKNNGRNQVISNPNLS